MSCRLGQELTVQDFLATLCLEVVNETVAANFEFLFQWISSLDDTFLEQSYSDEIIVIIDWAD